MSVLVHEFTSAITDLDGHAYRARACGERRRDGTWVGWLEFTPVSPGEVIWRTPRETTQPNLKALEYWSLGLEVVYLEGALQRAISATTLSAPDSPRTAPGAGPPSGE